MGYNTIFTMTEQIKSEFDLRLCFRELRLQQAKTRNNKAKLEDSCYCGDITLSKEMQNLICDSVEKQMVKNQSRHDTQPISTKVKYLEMALKLCHIHIDTEILYQILDVLKLVNEKKGETALSDICDLEKRWESEFRDKLEKDLKKAFLVIDEHISKNQ